MANEIHLTRLLNLWRILTCCKNVFTIQPAAALVSRMKKQAVNRNKKEQNIEVKVMLAATATATATVQYK